MAVERMPKSVQAFHDLHEKVQEAIASNTSFGCRRAVLMHAVKKEFGQAINEARKQSYKEEVKHNADN